MTARQHQDQQQEHLPKASCKAAFRILTDVIGTDLQCLLLPHEQPDALVLLVFQQANPANTSLLPFSRIVVKAIEFTFAAKKHT